MRGDLGAVAAPHLHQELFGRIHPVQFPQDPLSGGGQVAGELRQDVPAHDPVHASVVVCRPVVGVRDAVRGRQVQLADLVEPDDPPRNEAHRARADGPAVSDLAELVEVEHAGVAEVRALGAEPLVERCDGLLVDLNQLDAPAAGLLLLGARAGYEDQHGVITRGGGPILPRATRRGRSERGRSNAARPRRGSAPPYRVAGRPLAARCRNGRT